MKLLLLARTSGTVSEWCDRLETLSMHGWKVVVAPQSWDAGPKSAPLMARLRHDPAWSMVPPALALPGLSPLARLAARQGGPFGWFVYGALGAHAAVDAFLADTGADCVAVLDDGKSVEAFAPLLLAARAQGVPRMLVRGWGAVQGAAGAALFSDEAVPDASVRSASGLRTHGFGPIRIVQAADGTAAHRPSDAAVKRLLQTAGLDPQAPFTLYLCRSEDAAFTSATTAALETGKAVSALRRAAPDLQVAVLADADPSGPAQAVDAAGVSGVGVIGRVSPAAKTRALRRLQAEQAFRVLAGRAAFVVGETTTRLLDAATAGLPVLALPEARGLVETAGQTQRFAGAFLDGLDALASPLQGVASAPLPKVEFADILSACVQHTPRGDSRREQPGRGRVASLAKTVSRPRLPDIPPAVRRKVDRSAPVNIGVDDIDAVLAPMAASARPILVGPWISEVGFETLYWIPFLHWCVEHYQIDPARLVVCSRGGVAGWYGELAQAHYFDIFDMMDEAAFSAATMARFASAGGQKKHLDLGPLDDRVAEEARARTGVDQLDWLHPQLMYRFLRGYWLGRQGPKFYDEHTLARAFVPDPQQELEGALPQDYVAARFYFRSSFPDTPQNRAFATRLVAQLAEQAPVVLLDTGLSLDDHVEFTPAVEGNIHRIGHLITGRNNLALQTDVMRRSRLFVGTYGGLSYIPPFCGVPAIALSEDTEGLLSTHLETAIRIFSRMGVAFSHIDTAQAQMLMGGRPLPDPRTA